LTIPRSSRQTPSASSVAIGVDYGLLPHQDSSRRFDRRESVSPVDPVGTLEPGDDPAVQTPLGVLRF
jgi:hypothetical protein